MYQIWIIYLDFWGHDCKKWVCPTFGCKLVQSDPIMMQLKLHMSCHPLNVYTKFQIDMSKHVEEKSGKRGRTDRRRDGRTDIATAWYVHFSNGRIKRLPDLTTSLVDDCLIYRPIKNQQDSIALQQHLCSLDNWASIWGMHFNVKKYNILWISRSQTPIDRLYTLDGQPLDQVNEAKYLGITISNELDWSPHIDFITSKASNTLSFLRRNLRSCPQSLRELLQWRHNDHNGISNHQPHDCLLNRLFRLRWKKTSKLHWPLWGEFTGDRWISRTKGQ